MADREKVLKALEQHKETAVCNGCPYAEDSDTAQGYCPVYDDAIALLREQEPQETHLVRRYSRPGVYADLWLYCEVCGGKVDDNSNPKFCPNCGRKVKERG